MIILTICWIVIIAVASWAAVGRGDSKNKKYNQNK